MNRWQFSIRSLLVLTAILSIVLALAVKLPELFRVALIVAAPVLLIIALFLTANFATSERRPRFSVLSWILLGTFFALYAVAVFRMFFQVGGEVLGWPFIVFGVMATCCLACVYRACRSYLLIGRRRIADRDQAQTPAATAATRTE